jgi:hypothetical protein
VNLVGHVAVALDPTAGAQPSTDFLVGCMLPDLAAIARVRISRPDGETGRGVEFHHASDEAFHESAWFRSANCDVRDALLDDGVELGPARACSHAGVEMLLDGRLGAEPAVRDAARDALEALASNAGQLEHLAAPPARDDWRERLRAIGTTLDPARYREPRFIAERLQRMTNGRRRIELPIDQVDAVADALGAFQASIERAAPTVLAEVRRAVPSHLHPGSGS